MLKFCCSNFTAQTFLLKFYQTISFLCRVFRWGKACLKRITLTRNLNKKQGVLNKDCNAFGICRFQMNSSCNHAEDCIDVSTKDGHTERFNNLDQFISCSVCVKMLLLIFYCMIQKKEKARAYTVGIQIWTNSAKFLFLDLIIMNIFQCKMFYSKEIFVVSLILNCQND